jgi:cell wall-associated NlpC family hydrolase
MKAWLIPILLASSATVQASPPVSAEDDVARFMAEKGLFADVPVLAKIDKVGQQVSHRASELVLTAMGFLGVPYRFGGNSAESGFDCSGFVKAMYEKTVGLVLPRRADEQAAATNAIDRRDLQPGDLVFFNTMKKAFSHVGIYVGEGKFIHSPRPGAQVRLEDMGQSYWSHRFDGARRVGIGAQAAAPFHQQP